MDSIVEDIAVALIEEGVPATKYYVPQDVSLEGSRGSTYSAVTVNVLDDVGEGTKDTVGDEDKLYTVRIDIYTRLAMTKDTMYDEVRAVINNMTSYHVKYDGRVNLYDAENDLYHQVVEYQVKRR